MRKENSHRQKTTLKTPNDNHTPQNTNTLPPVNKNDSSFKSKNIKVRMNKTIKKKSTRPKVSTVKKNISKYIDTKMNIENSSNKYHLKKIKDFYMEQQHSLMKVIQEYAIKNITSEEHNSILKLRNKNLEDLYKKILEEKIKLESENNILRSSSEIDRNTIKGLVQQVNFFKYELEHMKSSNQRLNLVIQNQENVINNEKKTKQKLENTVIELNHAIHEHCAGISKLKP